MLTEHMLTNVCTHTHRQQTKIKTSTFNSCRQRILWLRYAFLYVLLAGFGCKSLKCIWRIKLSILVGMHSSSMTVTYPQSMKMIWTKVYNRQSKLNTCRISFLYLASPRWLSTLSQTGVFRSSYDHIHIKEAAMAAWPTRNMNRSISSWGA